MRDKAATFREWLAERLLGSRWATQAIADSEIDRVARHLGVDPELLLEVRAEAKIGRHALGLRAPLSKWHPQKGEYRRGYQFHLFMPKIIWDAWLKECAFRDVGGHLLLRSLIQEYLLGEREPCPLKTWRWGDKTYRMGDNDKRANLCERATIPQGANRALRIRALRIGATATSVARALVVETLTGLHRDVQLVETGMMFDDERRYLSRFRSPLDPG